MDLRVLAYFLAAADEENISHAAEKLHVSQPTVSRQLMELEKEQKKAITGENFFDEFEDEPLDDVEEGDEE